MSHPITRTNSNEERSAAPAPHMIRHNTQYPYSTTQLRSSLTSAPQFSSSSTQPNSTARDSSVIVTNTADETIEDKLHVKTVNPAQIAYCQPSTIACINCIGADTSPDNIIRKQGPVLLELRKLHTSTTTLQFTTSSLCLSRSNPSLGTSLASTCLDVAPESSLSSYRDPTLPPHIATGLTTGALCIHSFHDDENDTTAHMEYFQTPRPHRAATSVAWRPHHRHVAIGLGASSRTKNSPTTTTARSGTNNNTTEKEYGCLVWDVEHPSGPTRRTKSTPLLKLSHQSGVASVAWLPDTNALLAVGGQWRNLSLYDVRGKTSTPPVTVYAHNFAVHGIRVDPHRPWQLATYCQAANEPVKLWDARRMDGAVSEIKILATSRQDVEFSESTTTTVTALEWSVPEAGKLSVAVGDVIVEYDTLTATRPTLINTIYAGEPLLDFCLYPYTAAATSNTALEDRLLADFAPKRLLAVTSTDRSIQDVPLHTSAPLAISCRDGRLVHALGRTLFVGSTSWGPAAMEKLQIDPSHEDVSATMMRRARCLHVARYSMDTGSNIKILAEDGIVGEQAVSKDDLPPARDSLLRLWSWIERVEALCGETTADDLWGGEGISWPAKGLIDAGAWRLLRTDDTMEEDKQVFSESLVCMTYDSPGRRAALTSCGWAGKFNLDNVLGECEELGEYERSAALAVFHGDIGAAVDALERGATRLRSQLSDKASKQCTSNTSYYAETLELVSLSVAGYRGGDANSSSAVWRRACSHLMQRTDLAGESRTTGRLAYIRSLLKFLMSLGSDAGYQAVLGDTSLSLCDRVGFACRFLPRDELYLFIKKCIDACQVTGDCEGVTITGIEKDGIKILQSYVDRYTDVQTAALVTSRVVFPADWTEEREIALEWLDAYRSLLNSWQMWQSRAMFDVDRAELLRKVKLKMTGGKQPIRRVSSGKKMSGPRQPDPDIQAFVPAQLDARCNYCSMSLGLKNQDAHASLWLSKMKPILSCCPQCRKPLPRCAICMLSLGALNPYVELTKASSGKTKSGGGVSSQPPDDLSSLATLPFAEWFTWCMRCKHGGHAHHLVGWFAKHEVCPVSGCDCKCQFDGIQKLNRPALTQRKTEMDKIVKSNTTTGT